MHTTPSHIPGLIFILASLTGMAPLAIDAYLPAIPTIAASIGSNIHAVELSISIFLGGFGLGQLIGGPFSDHFGRRKATFTGLSIFFIGSLGICFIQSVEMLWLARFVQAIGGGIAVVNSNAIIRDMSSGRESARNLSNMALILMLAPLLAPVIGTLILKFSGWRAIFVFLLAYALLLITLFYFKMPETHVRHSQKISIIKRYWMVISHRQALAYVFSLASAQGALFAFITGSPSVYMEFFKLPETIYPIYFGVNILALIAANRINNRLLRKTSPHSLLTFGQLAQCVATAILFLYVILFNDLSSYIFAALMMLILSCHGFIMSNGMSSMIEFFPTNSATATALSGACGFTTGAVTGSLVGIFGDGTPLPMAVVLLGCALTGITLRTLLQRGTQEPLTAS